MSLFWLFTHVQSLTLSRWFEMPFHILFYFLCTTHGTFVALDGNVGIYNWDQTVGMKFIVCVILKHFFLLQPCTVSINSDMNESKTTIMHCCVFMFAWICSRGLFQAPGHIFVTTPCLEAGYRVTASRTSM